ncbi:hypothetical protein BDZ97DRAFT_1933755 [Flammula alnicola]|nr:hypothetical protein BDZ97DRAFT_1933755 [Flammula alnicola]
MTRNEDRYPDPHSFKPGRFFDDDGKLNDDGHILAYGFGRRVCVGKHVGSSTVSTFHSSAHRSSFCCRPAVAANILSPAAFNIRKAKDELGNEIEIKDDYGDYGLLKCVRYNSSFIDITSSVFASRHKKHFECSITPRSDLAKRLIIEANEN